MEPSADFQANLSCHLVKIHTYIHTIKMCQLKIVQYTLLKTNALYQIGFCDTKSQSIPTILYLFSVKCSDGELFDPFFKKCRNVICGEDGMEFRSSSSHVFTIPKYTNLRIFFFVLFFYEVEVIFWDQKCRYTC